MIKNNYETLSQAMNGLKERGYEKDLTDNIINEEQGKYTIVESYRFEGMTNPGDSSVLYAIESDEGEKGIIVDAYDAYSDSRKTDALRKMNVKS
ncbi:MAG TPA: phosphoribosylpyrophosphate synthetase [Bacteroidales bacterium]|nr:phosphoribosylpyrophosphate synthetase [Bacteroidales bacterium]